jgi:phosphatidylethanolamine/phosphatidyl-N-methylethanolamine N-methyltransferase
MGQTTVDAVYKRLAPIYDVVYGALLSHGRRSAIARLEPRPGESILEIGVGTGLSALHYPPTCRVAAIDVSAPMLMRAQSRLLRRRCRHVRLCRMDAAWLAFPDAHFDAVYAPYVLNVVTDRLQSSRKCGASAGPAGGWSLLNHFDHSSRRPIWMRIAGRLAVWISGVDWHLDLGRLLTATNLAAVSIEPVNLPPVSSVVVCRRA